MALWNIYGVIGVAGFLFFSAGSKRSGHPFLLDKTNFISHSSNREQRRTNGVSSLFLQGKSFKYWAAPSVRDIISRTNMFMTCLRDDDRLMSTLSKRSLASSYVISTEGLSRDDEKSFFWTFHPIDNLKNDSGSNGGGVGDKALRAMYEHDLNQNGSFMLQCQIHEGGLRVVTDSSQQEGALIAAISRVMVQAAFREFSETDQISIEVPCHDDPTQLCSEKYFIHDLLSDKGYAPLFSSLLPPETDFNSVEMSDMVNGEGESIGYIPRPILHKFNILHRGIGIIVFRDDSQTTNEKKQNVTLSKIYVHQRTHTKRIFPSLYDMFIGGISTTGEDLKSTAAREIGEELGLTTLSSLSNELFKCTICTSYNRCVVTVYTYRFQPSIDKIHWQEEEVQWGDFVDYKYVEKSAAMSIDRLRNSGSWPGSETDALNLIRMANHGECAASHDEQWDYVPDGLLVWVAWVQWLQNETNRFKIGNQ